MDSEIKEETIQDCISIKTSLKIQVREVVRDFLKSFNGKFNVSNLIELPEKKENYRISDPVSPQCPNTFYGFHKVDYFFKPCCFRVYQPAQLPLFKNEIRFYNKMSKIDKGIHQLHEIIFSNDSQVVILCLDYRRFSPFTEVSASLSNNISVVSENSNISYIFQILQQLLSNLNNIHKNRLCHRNISPNSVVINYPPNNLDCPVVITDFSYSYQMVDNCPKLQNVVGYLNYRAPELLDPKCVINQIDYTKVDIWAAGCFIHDLVTQMNPFFLGKEKKEVLASINEHLGKDGDLKKEIMYANKCFKSGTYSMRNKIFVVLGGMLHREPKNRRTAEKLLIKYFNSFGI